MGLASSFAVGPEVPLKVGRDGGGVHDPTVKGADEVHVDVIGAVVANLDVTIPLDGALAYPTRHNAAVSNRRRARANRSRVRARYPLR